MTDDARILNAGISERIIAKGETLCIEMPVIPQNDLYRENWIQSTKYKVVGTDVDISDWGVEELHNLQKGVEFTEEPCFEFPDYTPAGSYIVDFLVQGHSEADYEHYDPYNPEVYQHDSEMQYKRHNLDCIRFEFKVSRA